MNFALQYLQDILDALFGMFEMEDGKLINQAHLVFQALVSTNLKASQLNLALITLIMTVFKWFQTDYNYLFQ